MLGLVFGLFLVLSVSVGLVLGLGLFLDSWLVLSFRAGL